MLAPLPACQSHFLRFQSHDVIVAKLKFFQFRRRKWIAASWALLGADMHQLPAQFANLDRSFSIAFAFALGWLDRRDWTMRLHHACKVQHQAVIGVAFDAHPSAGHLDVKAGAHGRTQHGDQIDVRIIKASGQHIGIGQRTQAPSLKVGQHSIALCLWRGSCDAGCLNTMRSKHPSHVLRVLNASAEKQPSLAIASQFDDLTHHAQIVLVGVNCCLQFALDKLTATLMHARRIERGLCDLAAQRREITFIDQFLDRDWLDQIVKQRRLVGDQSMPQTVRSGGQAHHTQRGIDRLQLSQERSIATFILMADQMALIDDAKINMPNLARTFPDRLDASEGDWLAKLLATKPSRVNAHWCATPMKTHFLCVLFQNFLHMA